MTEPLRIIRRRVAGSFDRISEDREHHVVDRRRVLFTLRLTDAEMDMLNEAAAHEKRNVSDVIRARLFIERPRTVGVRPRQVEP